MAAQSLVERVKRSITEQDGELSRKTALVTGSVAVGALVTGSLFRRIRHLSLCTPEELEPAIEADAGEFEIMEGTTRYYIRDGSGVPLVLLHSFNAAASSREMKPVFEYFAAETDRPLYAVDWFGFGRSDRPPVRYSPAMYLRQLRRFLSELVHQPADLVALSLSCEYAAQIAGAMPYLVRNLVLISPTGLSDQTGTSAWQRAAVSVADSIGAFEIFFFRLSREEMLRRFYERQVFRGPVPDELLTYASKATRVYGAHHAPRYFVQGLLSTGASAEATYAGMHVPTLMFAPESGEGLIQQFDRLDDLATTHLEHIRVVRTNGGLMPHWDCRDEFFASVDEFLRLA